MKAIHDIDTKLTEISHKLCASLSVYDRLNRLLTRRQMTTITQDFISVNQRTVRKASQRGLVLSYSATGYSTRLITYVHIIQYTA